MTRLFLLILIIPSLQLKIGFCKHVRNVDMTSLNSRKVNETSSSQVGPLVNRKEPKGASIASREQLLGTKSGPNFRMDSHAAVSEPGPFYLISKRGKRGLGSHRGAFGHDARWGHPTCSEPTVGYRGRCVPVTSIELIFILPVDVPQNECLMTSIVNKIIYFSSNGKPSLRLKYLEVKHDRIGRVLIDTLDEGIDDPYMVNMTSRYYAWENEFGISSDKVVFKICPNSESELCVVKYVLGSYVDITGAEMVSVQTCESCDLVQLLKEISNTDVPEVFGTEADPRVFGADGTNFHNNDDDDDDNDVEDDDDDDDDDDSAGSQLGHAESVSSHEDTNKNESSRHPQDSELHDHSENTSEDLEFQRCCHCKRISKQIFADAPCPAIAFSLLLVITGSELFHDILQKPFHEIHRSILIRYWYHECMEHTAFVPTRTPVKDCPRHCFKVVDFFKKTRRSYIPALAWNAKGTTHQYLFALSFSTSPTSHQLDIAAAMTPNYDDSGSDSKPYSNATIFASNDANRGENRTVTVDYLGSYLYTVGFLSENFTQAVVDKNSSQKSVFQPGSYLLIVLWLLFLCV